MRIITTNELSCMEVINLCDGAKLGCPTDFEVDVEEGCVVALLLPKDTGFLNFGKSELYRIPWKCLQCIGEDTILVKLTPAELTSCLCRPSHPKRKGFGSR